MKFLFAFILIFSSFAVSAQSDKPQVGSVINLDSIKTTPKTEAQLTQNASKTLHTAIYKGVKYPIYVTKNTKLFIIVKSPTSGNYYRKYIPQDKVNLQP